MEHRPFGAGIALAPVRSMAGIYAPRSPTTGVLYGAVRARLTAFLATVAARTDGSGRPAGG